MAKTGAEAAGEVWAIWGKLQKIFPVWSLFFEGFYTPGAWGYMGVDFVSGFRKNRSTAQVFQLLEGVDEATFDALSALASLNARRHDQMVRAVIIGYLTVPVSIAALLAELMGDSVMNFVRANTWLTVHIVGTITLGPLGYMMGQWRSRQIVGVLDLIRIERGQAPFTALELREE